jgi:signal transduction histidine kinase/CheY-like chemotaxis protein
MNHTIALPAAASSPSVTPVVAEPRPIRRHWSMARLLSAVGWLWRDGSWLSRYATAIAALALATVARQLLDPALDNRAPYGIYLIAVFFVVWRAGLGPALVTVCGGIFLGRYLFDVPRGSLAFAESNQASLFMSLTIGIVAVIVCESLRITARDNRRLYEMARQEDARKDQFLANLAHELRNPLMPIRNAVHLLSGATTKEPRMLAMHDLIGRHTEHLVRLVNDLLEVSRITQGKIELQREHVDLQSIIDGAVEVVRPLTAEKRQILHLTLPPGKVWLLADGVRLTQVLTNLLHNAAKYTGSEGRIGLSVECNGDELVIRVRDTGIGIAPQMRQQIFNLFEQVPEAMEHSRGGLGIGLTLVRTLVELHGGTVEAKSPGLGLGSEFVVRLPGVAQHHRISQAGDQLKATAADGPPLRILVVDDAPAVAKTLEMILSDWHHIVETKPDAFSALESVRAFKPDLILADLGMPGMNGYQFAEQLREMPDMQDIALIAVSGYGQEADKEKSKAVGFTRHLVKPVDLMELRQILATYQAHSDAGQIAAGSVETAFPR